MERARRRAVRPVGDDAVGRHAARAAGAVDRGERPRPGGRLGHPDDLVGAGPAQRPADHRLHALPLGRRRRRGRQVATTSPDVRTARDVIPYDGRTLPVRRDGHQRRRPRGAAGEPVVVHVERHPVDPVGQRHDADRATARSGSPSTSASRGPSSFTAIRWSGGGKSGTHACGCAPGSQVVFSVGPFDTSPTKNRTITVWTVNSGGSESNRVSDSATPYGDTLTPTGFNGSRSGATGATWSWNLPDERPAHRPGRARRRRQRHLRRQQDLGDHRPRAGHLPAAGARALGRRAGRRGPGFQSVTVPPAGPAGLQRPQGPEPGRPQRRRVVHLLAGLPRDRLRHPRLPAEPDVHGRSARAPGRAAARPAARCAPTRSGNGYSWDGRCLFADGTGPVTVVVPTATPRPRAVPRGDPPRHAPPPGPLPAPAPPPRRGDAAPTKGHPA